MMITTAQMEVPVKHNSETKEALILGHCILNMNTRAPGIAAWQGSILPIMRTLQKYHGEIHQYPCLEAAVVGMRRWWHVKEQYDTFTFRSVARMLSKIYSNYFRRSGINKVKLLGLGLSPTCGYRYTQSDPSWGGRPKEINPIELIKKGSGVLIEEMMNEFSGSGIELEVMDVSLSLIYPDYESRAPATKEYPSTPSEALEEIEAFLQTEISFEPKEISHISGLKEDLRSKKTLVIPRKLFEIEFEKVLRNAERGIGISLIEDIHSDEEELKFMSSIYASMIGNLIVAGHEVRFVIGGFPLNDLIQNILEKLEEFFPRGSFSIKEQI